MKNLLKIIFTTQAEWLAQELKKKTCFKTIHSQKNKEAKRFFPDQEVYVRIPPIFKKKDRVVILHTWTPNPNSGLMELRNILGILKANGIKKTEVFFSYFPYGMQDAVFKKGELNVAKSIIEELLYFWKVKKIYTIDAHFSYRKWIKKYPLINYSFQERLREEAKKDFPDLIFLAPDKGAIARTKLQGFSKRREDSYTVWLKNKNKTLEKLIKGKNVGVVDDLLETGETLISCYRECKRRGAQKVIALVTHGVLPAGIARVSKIYQKLYLSNTIKQKSNPRVCLCNILPEIIKILKQK